MLLYVAEYDRQRCHTTCLDYSGWNNAGCEIAKGKGTSVVDTNDIIDAREAAEFLSIHDDTLRRLARENKIPAFKIGGVWRFSKSTLMQWAGSQRPQRQPRRTVLIVDDEAFMRDVISQTIEESGFRAVTAVGGREALEIMRRDLPDVVLLDLKMPDMDGPATLREIRKAHGSVPVIIITGYPESDLMADTLDYCPVTLLAKPLDPDVMVQTLEDILNGTTGAKKGE